MTFVSYAQNFEDVMLWRALKQIQNGSYLDIGAQDPSRDSVSLAFYQRGWRGIHVEPVPGYAALLRAARPEEIVIEAAITETVGPIEFFEIPDTGLSTGKLEIAERHLGSGFDKRKILVPTVRLDNLLASVTGDIHWMKIDVEGMETEVLKSWGDHPCRPWVLLIEATFPNTQERTDDLWIEEVRQRGYQEAHFDGLSRYFVHVSHSDLARCLDTPANVFDAFHVTSAHFTAGLLNENFEAELKNIGIQAGNRETQLTQELLSSHQALDAASKSISQAQLEQSATLEALAASERECRNAIDSMWRERNELENRVREQCLEIERGLREKLSSAEVQMRQHAADLAGLRERSAQQEERIDQIRQDAEDARQQIIVREAEISALRSTVREQQAQAAAQIAERSQQVARADEIIRRAIVEPIGRWQRLGRALALFQEDGARRVLSIWSTNSCQPAASDLEMPMSVPSGAGRNPYLRANSLPELLSWDDVDFVRCAYVTILGRQPDPTGETYYISRIRRGRTKEEILWQMRNSTEGRKHDPGIAGLDRALKAARWRRFNPFRRPMVKAGRPAIVPAAEHHSDLMRLEQQFLSVAGKIDQMQRSLSLLEGAALKEVEVKPAINSKLSVDIFRTRLAFVASKIEREQK